MSNKIKLTPEQQELIKSFSSVETDNGKYYVVPHWFYQQDGEDNFELISFEKMPSDLLRAIAKEREAIWRP